MATKDEIKKFSDMIESIVKEKKIGFMDAVILHCESVGFEIELAATLLTNPIKAKISEEAQSLNMIKRVNKLPL